MYLSCEETLLIDAIEDVAFGKLIDVDIPNGEQSEERRISGNNAKLIRLIRRKGIKHLLTITVHEGQAQQIEVSGEIHGHRFVKKIKL